MTPLRHRPLDLFLVVAFASFALSTFTVDVWAVTGRMHGDDLLANALRGYTTGADPLFGAMPRHVWVLMLLSLVCFGPMDVAVVIALARGRAWIREPGLFFCGMQSCAMLVYFGFEAFGDLPPLSWPTVIAANAPYLLLPMLLAWRLTARPLQP
jgi:hypothetical protein